MLFIIVHVILNIRDCHIYLVYWTIKKVYKIIRCPIFSCALWATSQHQLQFQHPALLNSSTMNPACSAFHLCLAVRIIILKRESVSVFFRWSLFRFEKEMGGCLLIECDMLKWFMGLSHRASASSHGLSLSAITVRVGSKLPNPVEMGPVIWISTVNPPLA